MKTFTLQELIQRDKREWFTADEICGVLNIDPQTLRETARQRPELLGFPSIITGSRVRFPRRPFLAYMGVIQQ